jgi:ABC-type lipoprotein export system ATPase subunit
VSDRDDERMWRPPEERDRGPAPAEAPRPAWHRRDPTGPVLVAAAGVRKTYRRGPEEVHALDGVDFELHSGEVVGLVGPSGSGKTTLLNLLCGWEHPDAGEIRWAGDGRVPPERRPWADLAILPQSLGLVEELSVRENVQLPVRLARGGTNGAAARVYELIGALGLERLANRTPMEISLGEQQRSALARALVLSPRLLLADEPTGHQDAQWGRGVFGVIREAAASGTCCLVATHNREAMRFVDRLLSMKDGRVHEVGDAGDLGE